MAAMTDSMGETKAEVLPPKPNKAERDPIKEDSRQGEASQKAARDAIRAACRDRLLACAKESGTAMSAKDVEDYIRMGMAEDALSFAKEEAKKTDALRQHRSEYVPLFVSQTKAAGARALALLQEARAEKAISTENMAEWKGRLKAGKWADTRSFIEKKLPTYVANWKKVAADRRALLKDPRFKALKTSGAIGKADLAEFTNNVAFLNAHYDRRKALVAMVKSAMNAVRGSDTPLPKLKAQAKAKLAGAAAAGILAKNKVDGWMQRIFKSGKTPDQIEAFLNGNGGDSLGGLMANWAEARKHFDKVDGRIQKEGAPRGFHVVHLDVFLGWHYDKRMAYIEKAERSFSLRDIAERGERTELNASKLEIGHAMHMKDWEYADELAGDALKKFPKDAQLLSMKKTAAGHLREGGKSKEGDLEGKLQRAQEETQEIIDTQFPDSEKKHIARACEHPDKKNIERVAQLWYNRVWCHKHRFLSKETENKQRESEVNKEKTRHYQNYGHSRVYEANILGGDTAKQEAIRDNCRKPQVLHVKEDGKSAAYEKIKNNRNDEWFGYWTSYIPEGLEYEKHKYIVENQMYKLKRNKRLLAAHGRDFRYNEQPKAVAA